MDIKMLRLTAAESILKSFETLNQSHDLIAAELADMFEYPPDPSMGDLALPCFRLSKALRRSPVQIAQTAAAGFSCEYIRKAEAVNGYLNLYISNDFYLEGILSGILAQGDSYGSSNVGNGKNVVLDYSSPNVCKPFHIGHLGTTVIGHSLKKLFEFSGYNCIGVNHLGDWGTQFGKQIVAYRRWGNKEEVEAKGVDGLVELYVRFHNEAEKHPELEEEARVEFTKLEHGDPANLALWKWFIEISIADYKKTYRQLGIEFDSYCGESFYFDKAGSIVDELREKGLLKIDNGASIVDLEEYGMPPCMILKSDGSTIYAVRDIAAAKYRKDTYDFSKCVYITSSQQCLHFSQVFKVVELMGYKWAADLVHVPYGTVSINGARLATRTGNVILLRDLFDTAIEKVREIMAEKNPDLENSAEVAEAVGVGAIVFHYLYNNRIKDINFIMEDALSFDGNTGPYAQYTHARACSILERGGYCGADSKIGDVVASESEMSLIKTLAAFPDKVSDALSAYEPSVITRYIIEICSAFNRFYQDCPILSSEGNVRELRLRLTKAAEITLRNALSLICMKAPEKI